MNKTLRIREKYALIVSISKILIIMLWFSKTFRLCLALVWMSKNT